MQVGSKRRLLSTCIALAACAAAQSPLFTPPPNRPGESAWIPLRHQRQERNLCVPTSASIILDYFGDSISPREIKSLALNKEYRPRDTFTDFSITFFSDLLAGLARRGYRWKEESYSNDARGFKKGLAEIEQSLDQGLPVMIDTSPPHLRHIGHTFVVAGYSVPDQTLFAVDPDRPSPGFRPVTFRELEAIWNSRNVGSSNRGAVFPERRKGEPGTVSRP